MNKSADDVFLNMQNLLNDNNFKSQFKPVELKKEASVELTEEQKLYKSALNYLMYAGAELDYLGFEKSAAQLTKSLYNIDSLFNKKANDFVVDDLHVNEEDDPEIPELDEIVELPEDHKTYQKQFDKDLEDLKFDNALAELNKELDNSDELEVDDEEMNPYMYHKTKPSITPPSDSGFEKEENWFDEEDDDFFDDLDSQLGIDTNPDLETQKILDFEKEFDRSNRLLDAQRGKFKNEPQTAPTRVLNRKW